MTRTSTVPSVERPLVAGIVLLATLSCGAPDSRPADAPATSRERRVVDVAWDTLWTVGGSREDTLLLLPWNRLAADSELVYVLEAGAYRVIAFDLSDGSTAWTAGRKGNGPNEFASLIAVETLPAGGIAVADPENGRIALLGRDGTFEGLVPVREIGRFDSLCPLADGTILLTTFERDRPIVRLGRDGAITATYLVPWPDLRDVPPIRRQARLRPSPDRKACMLALNLGRGFAWFSDGAFREPRTYVEWFDLPEASTSVRREGDQEIEVQRVTEYRIAVNGVHVGPDDIAVLFQGLTERASRLIDFYDSETRDYLRTWLLPDPAYAFTRYRDTYLLLDERDGYPLLVALRPRHGAP